MTVPGRVNLVGLLAIFVLVIGGGAVDVLQAIVRVWKAHYETGLPSFLHLPLGLWLVGPRMHSHSCTGGRVTAGGFVTGQPSACPANG
jgi:hypothetical protein